MHRIGRGGDEIEFLVEVSGFLVLGMHGEGANTGNLRRLQYPRPLGLVKLAEYQMKNSGLVGAQPVLMEHFAEMCVRLAARRGAKE